MRFANFVISSAPGFIQRQIADDTRRLEKRIGIEIESLLACDTFDYASVAALAERGVYPAAARILDGAVSSGCISVLSVLYDRRSSRSLCVAIFQCLFGSTTIEATSAGVDVITVDSFRERLADPTTRERALAGLALIGELPWREAPRKARAAMLLRDLVAAMCARVS